MTQTHSLVALDLEYRLTIAHRIGCECEPYLVGRREVLIPAVLEQALHYDRDHHTETRAATRRAELEATTEPLFEIPGAAL